MKDILTFFVLLILCMLVEDPETKTVFNDIENQDIIKNYCLEIKGLNTNNFFEYIDDLEVVTINPYINPVYKEKIMKIYVYEDINKFRKMYVDTLKENGFYHEANKYILRPIVIEKICINASLNDIYTTLNEMDYEILNK